jgi:hypothetical protein
MRDEREEKGRKATRVRRRRRRVPYYRFLFRPSSNTVARNTASIRRFFKEAAGFKLTTGEKTTRKTGENCLVVRGGRERERRERGEGE